MHDNLTDPDISVSEIHALLSSEETQKLEAVPQPPLPHIVETPPPSPSPEEQRKKVADRKLPAARFTQREAANARMLQERCRQLCLSLFFREHAPVHSLGFTSSIAGEGKSFLALVTAQVLAHDSDSPVTLIECNWEHPTLHEYFGIPCSPGLAEWLRGSCHESDIRYEVGDNLTFIPAGYTIQDAVKLVRQIKQRGLRNLFTDPNELFVVELPPILTSGYGSLAAGLLDSNVLVVRAQAVSDKMVAETCDQLKHIPMHGIILNQNESHIPRWIRQLL